MAYGLKASSCDPLMSRLCLPVKNPISEHNEWNLILTMFYIILGLYRRAYDKLLYQLILQQNLS